METVGQSSQPMNNRWMALFAANLILGVLFWVGLSTDYKLKNVWADIGFT